MVSNNNSYSQNIANGKEVTNLSLSKLHLKYFTQLDQANHDHKSGQPLPEEKIFKDDELVSMIDPILETDDKNNDGYIDYSEFVIAQQAAQAAQAQAKQ